MEIIYDDSCNLCSGFISHIKRSEGHENFQLTPLASQGADQVREEHDIGEEEDTIIFIRDGKVYKRSEAVFEILKQLEGWPRWFSVLKILPAPLRDFGYRLIARNRYKWFGRKEESC